MTFGYGESVVGAGYGCGRFFRSGHYVTIKQREYLATYISFCYLMISKDHNHTTNSTQIPIGYLYNYRPMS